MITKARLLQQEDHGRSRQWDAKGRKASKRTANRESLPLLMPLMLLLPLLLLPLLIMRPMLALVVQDMVLGGTHH
jgi:hypothetical protein